MEDKSIEAVQKFSLEVLEERGGDRITTLDIEENENYRAYSRTARCFHRSDCKYVYVITERGVFILEYQVSSSYFDKMLPIFDPIVDSFNVIEN